MASLALKPGRPLKRELKRLVRRQLERAEERLSREPRLDQDVHEARTCVKKVEALARLLDQVGSAPPRKDVRRLREARQRLSRVRDADAAIVTFDRVCARFADRIPEHTAATIHSHLDRRKATMMRRARTGAGSLARAAKTLRQVRRSARAWAVPAIDAAELPGILRRSFRACERAMGRAHTRARAADFHAWRKRVKALWYQLRLAERLISGLGRQIEEFGELETWLGEEHNLVVLRNALEGDRRLRRMRSRIDDLRAMSTALEEELRRSALVLGARLHRRSAKAFARDLRRRLRQ